MILTIAKVGLMILFGFSIINFLGFRGRLLEKLGLSFLLSTGLMSVLYFFYIWKTNHVEAFEFWIITIVLTVILFVLKRPRVSFKQLRLPEIHIKSDFVVIFCWVIILTLFATSIIISSYTPVHNPDSIYLFDFRAKVMFVSQRLRDITQILNWAQFPMFTSMIGLIWRFLGIDNPSSYYPLMYLSFALVFYSTLRKVLDKNLASVGTLLMYVTPITFWQSQLDGLTNLPYTVFLCLSVFYIYSFMKIRKPPFSDIFLSSIFLGLSSWTRGIEPIWVVPLFLAACILVFKNKMWMIFIYYLVFELIREIWPTFVNQKYTSVDTGLKVIVNSLATNNSTPFHFGQALYYTVSSMLTLLSSSLGLIWYLFILVFVFSVVSRTFSYDQFYFLASIVGILGVIFIGSLYMVIDFHLVIDVYNDSLSRLLGVLPPLLWFCIMLNPAWISIENVFKFRKK
jgi:hypothetical protein